MPITLRKINAQVKDPNTGDMIPAGILSSDSITQITATENSAITRITNEKTSAINEITQMKETIPSDYADFSAEAAYKDMIAQTQAAMTATKAYTIGEYICINKKLYKTTTAITSGLALVVGTNVEEIKLAESVSASAAQIAKNTSDISGLKTQLLTESLPVLSQGSINSQNGKTADDATSMAKRVRTESYILIDTVISVKITSDLQLNVFWYTDEDPSPGFLGSTGFVSVTRYDIQSNRPTGATRFKVVIKYISNADINKDNITIAEFHIETSKLTEIDERIGTIENPVPFSKSLAFCNIEKKFTFGNGNSGECFATKNGVTQLWGFNSAPDDHSAQASIFRKVYDRATKSMTAWTPGKHNLGHVNSCSYNDAKDAFVCGNGSDEYGTDGKIFIIEDAFDKTNLLYEDALVIDFTGHGSKVNVIWGDSNDGLHNVVFCITNDGYDIYRVELGENETILESGTAQKSSGFNGTYKILQHWEYGESKKDYDNVVQGAFFTGQYVGWGFGHRTGRIPIHKVYLLNDGNVETEEINYRTFDVEGAEKKVSLSGAAWFDGYIFVTYSTEIYMVKD